MIRRVKSGQVSAEFIGVMTIMFIIFLIFAGVMTKRMTDLNSQGTWQRLVDTAALLKSEFDLASSVENGYKREFTMPMTIDQKVYNVTILTGDGSTQNKSIFQIRYVNFSMSTPYSVTIPLKTKGTINRGLNSIRKNNSWICVNLAQCP